LKAFFYYF
jgi:hypothetical protein